MSSVTIISGCPGTGKTSVASRLAAETPKGVHIESDLFYHFIPHRILPILPESKDQNVTVITAVARAAAAFAQGGYDVFLEGVFGPWFVPLLATELEPAGVPVDYVVLRAPLDVTLARSTRRDEPDLERIVRHMHRHFADLNELERHAIDTSSQTLDETVAEIIRRRPLEDFRLDLARLT